MKLKDFIMNLFNSDKAITNADGQKTITLESVLPDIDDGVTLFSDELPKESENFVTFDKLVNYVDKEELNKVIERLIKIESLISAVDNLNKDVNDESFEVW